jgi:hypothetical protein
MSSVQLAATRIPAILPRGMPSPTSASHRPARPAQPDAQVSPGMASPKAGAYPSKVHDLIDLDIEAHSGRLVRLPERSEIPVIRTSGWWSEFSSG